MSFLHARLNETIICGNATNLFQCGFVPQHQVRGSTQMLLTFLVPILSSSFGTLYMKAGRAWWRKLLEFLLRLFFPEISLWNITQEEISRARYLAYLHDLGIMSATRQQLMAIQKGSLRFATSSITEELPFDSLDKISSTVLTRERKLDTNNAGVEIRWGLGKSDSSQILDITDIHLYKHILESLPTGRHTWKGIGYPDIGEVLLVLQLIWLMTTIILRLVSGFQMSLLELFCLFSLTAFAAERFITQLNIPAWNEDATFSITSSDSKHPIHNSIMVEEELPTTKRRHLLILPVLQFLGWPIFMFVYATKSGSGLSGSGMQAMTNPVCLAAGGVYTSAFVWAFIGGSFAGSEGWSFLKWIPFVISGFAFVLSKFLVLSLGMMQVVQGPLGIYLVLSSQWTIPHISG